MMPAIIICLILNEQLGLILHTTPFQDELACPAELLDRAPNRLCIQVGPTDLPRSAWRGLFPLQKTLLYESFDRTVTYTAQPSGFIQADSLGIS